jgi:hypothetical protein
MSNTRIFWIIWCSMWALAWLLIGFFTFFIGWIGVPISLLCILIPIGSSPRPQWVQQQQMPWQPYPGTLPNPPGQPYPQPLPAPGYYQNPDGSGTLRWWDRQYWR